MTGSPNLRLRIKTDRAAAIAVSLAPVLYFLPALLQGKVLCPADGLLQNVPFRMAAAQIVRAGHLPLWDPYIFSGMPLFATAQVGILYPLNWFYLTFSPAIATNLMIVATYAVAALGAYLYARQIGASVVGAVITSLAWQFGGAAIGQISHINIVHTAALLPWVLWSVDRYAEKGNIKRGALISILIAVQFFAGHQQAFVNSLLLVFAYLAVMMVAHPKLRRRYLAGVAFIMTGLSLAAVQILPTFELLSSSERSAATYEFFTSFSMPKRFILTFVAPYVMGGGDGRLFRAPYIGPPFYPEMVGYVGLLAIILGVAALLIKPDLRTKFWAIVALICLLLAFGGYAPLYFYKLLYYVPVLNLFRVPARHLMEVDFALAVLAGRGFTILSEHRTDLRVRIIVLTSALAVFVFTILAVTLLRPAEFHLARAVPVTLLRAPELFVPVGIAAVSAYALWLFVNGKRGATVLMLAVLLFDLALWGQSSGWYVESPRTTDQYFHQPEIVQALNKLVPADRSSFRILTAPHQFDPAVPPVPPSVSPSTDWVLWTQPDIYMMHGIQNAAGYDGFGLARYSQLVGRMKVWGELTDPDATLRGNGREIDLANVRFLLSMRTKAHVNAAASGFLKADQKLGDYLFAGNDLGLSSLLQPKALTFSVPPVQIDRVGLVTNLAWSENIPDNTTVARLRLHLADGRTLEFPLRAGTDTSEWSYERPDISAHIRHRKATVAASYKVNEAQGSYDAHTYVTTIALPQTLNVVGGEIVLEPDARWPDLSMVVFRISLINQAENQTYPLARSMVSMDDEIGERNAASSRWKLLTQTSDVDVYENSRSLPRAWLATQTKVLDEPSMLAVIRDGKFKDGAKWEPETTALIESPLAGITPSGNGGTAQITRYEPNQIDLITKSETPSVLVLSENHYPGWRAYVDGRFVDTLRVDYNLRGVALGPGQHTVEFLYRPKSVLAGVAISILTLMVLGVGSLRAIDLRIGSFAQRAFKRIQWL
jgi:hypothetical protein